MVVDRPSGNGAADDVPVRQGDLAPGHRHAQVAERAQHQFLAERHGDLEVDVESMHQRNPVAYAAEHILIAHVSLHAPAGEVGVVETVEVGLEEGGSV